jgi:hypothetical protein
VPQSTRTRGLPLLIAGLGLAAIVLGDAPTAAADSTNGEAVCHSSTESGIEVDTCVGNPDPPSANPGAQVRVVPEFCFGLGFGGCDD